MNKWLGGKILLTVLVVGSLILAGCAGEVEKEKQTITIADKGYASCTVSLKLIQIVLEDELGYPVETPLLSWPLAWAGIGAGDVDVDPDLWYAMQRQGIDKYLYELKIADRLGPVYPDCPQGWVVPNYVAEEYGITKIEDLNDNAALFDEDGDGRGEIYIGPSGWTATEVDQIKIKSYELNYEWHSLDEWACHALVRGKIEKQEPVLFYAYQPHWVFAMWDITWIEEPPNSADLWNYIEGDLEGSYIACSWELVDVYVGVRSALKDEAPDVYKFLQNYKISKDTVNFLIMEIEDVPGNPPQDPATVCRKWLDENPDILAEWLAGID